MCDTKIIDIKYDNILHLEEITQERTLICEDWWKIRNVNVNNFKRYIKVPDKGFFISLNLPIFENE